MRGSTLCRLPLRTSFPIPLGSEVIISEPKTARGRRLIALDADTIEVLKAQAARQLGEQAAGASPGFDSGYLCTKEDGRPYHPEVVSRYFRGAGQGCWGTAAISPHGAAPHPRHPGAAGLDSPQGGSERLVNIAITLEHLLARHPRDAGGGGSEDRRLDLRGAR